MILSQKVAKYACFYSSALPFYMFFDNM